MIETVSEEENSLKNWENESSSKFARHKDALVIFLHGSGDTGEGLKSWLADDQIWNGQFEAKLLEQGVRVVFPTAIPKHYSLWGSTGNVWFDRSELTPQAPEDVDGIEDSLNQIEAVIREALTCGISPNKIILGGFSMGGGMALQCMRHLHMDWAGIFALSSFLQETSGVWMGESYDGEVSWPPVLMMHGTSDDLVPLSWGLDTAERLKKIRVPVIWEEYKSISHELSSDEISRLCSWILERLDIIDPASDSVPNETKNMKIQPDDDTSGGHILRSKTAQPEKPEASFDEKGIHFAVTKQGNQAIAIFDVPEGSEELLCAAQLLARGSFFQLEKAEEGGKVKVSFYSPAPDVTARAIADRISQRLEDPNPPGAENCVLS